MQVNADWILPVYQILGPIVRVHWDYETREIDDGMGGIRVTYDAQEAVLPLDADRATFVSIVDADGGDGEALADGWFNSIESYKVN